MINHNTEGEIHSQVEDPVTRTCFSIGCTVICSIVSRTKQFCQENDELNSLCGGRKKFQRFHCLGTYFFVLEH